MKPSKFSWIFGAVLILFIIIIPIVIFFSGDEKAISSDPWENVPLQVPHTDHSAIIEGPFETGQDVTRACLECHEDAAQEIMATAHWTWESKPYQIEDRDSTVTVGKRTPSIISVSGSRATGLAALPAMQGMDGKMLISTSARKNLSIAWHATIIPALM